MSTAVSAPAMFSVTGRTIRSVEKRLFRNKMLQLRSRRNRFDRDQKVLRPVTTTGGVKTQLCLNSAFVLLCRTDRIPEKMEEGFSVHWNFATLRFFWTVSASRITVIPTSAYSVLKI